MDCAYARVFVCLLAWGSTGTTAATTHGASNMTHTYTHQSTPQHTTAHQTAAHHSTRSTTQHTTAQRSTAQRSTAKLSTAHHSTAQRRVAQRAAPHRRSSRTNKGARPCRRRKTLATTARGTRCRHCVGNIMKLYSAFTVGTWVYTRVCVRERENERARERRRGKKGGQEKGRNGGKEGGTSPAAKQVKQHLPHCAHAGYVRCAKRKNKQIDRQRQNRVERASSQADK